MILLDDKNDDHYDQKIVSTTDIKKNCDKLYVTYFSALVIPCFPGCHLGIP